jgi:hypothetical protein
MGGQGNEEVAWRQVLDRRQRPHPGHGLNARLDRLRLVGRHQRSAAGVAEQHDGLHAGQLAQPPHAHADLGERVVEQEMGLVSAEARVPAEEAEAALGHQCGQVMLGEVDVVVRRDECGPRPSGRRPVVQALARVAAGAGPADHRRGQPDELPENLGHRGSVR